MNDRKPKIYAAHTIGNMPCEVNFADILQKLDSEEPNVAARLAAKFCHFRRHLNTLMEWAKTQPKSAGLMLDLWRKSNLEGIDRYQDQDKHLSAYTHLKCCIVSNYRKNRAIINQLQKDQDD